MVVFQELMSSFEVPSKALIFETPLTGDRFYNAFSTQQQSPLVESLKIQCDAHDSDMLHMVSELTNLLKNFERIFPNLKEADMNVEFTSNVGFEYLVIHYLNAAAFTG